MHHFVLLSISNCFRVRPLSLLLFAAILSWTGHCHRRSHGSELDQLQRHAAIVEKLKHISVDYDIMHVIGDRTNHILAIQEMSFPEMHFSRVVHLDWKSGRIRRSGDNDQDANWFVWTPGFCFHVWENKRVCYTWNDLPTEQTYPGLRFYSALIGCLPPHIRTIGGDSSGVSTDLGIEKSLLYFPDLVVNGSWERVRSEGDSRGECLFRKQQGQYGVTTHVSEDGSRMYRKVISRNDRIIVGIEYSEHRPIHDFWLPYCIKIHLGVSGEHREIRVRDLCLDGNFTFDCKLKPGTIVRAKQTTSDEAFLPGGLDFLDEIVSRARELSSEAPNETLNRNRNRKSIFGKRIDELTGTNSVLGFLLGLVLGGVALLTLRKLRRSHFLISSAFKLG